MGTIAKSRGVRLLFFAILPEIVLHVCWAQDLSPRAYVITPLHSNAINLTYSFYHGGLDFNGVVPVTGATGTYSDSTLVTSHSMSLRGKNGTTYTFYVRSADAAGNTETSETKTYKN